MVLHQRYKINKPSRNLARAYDKRQVPVSAKQPVINLAFSQLQRTNI